MFTVSRLFWDFVCRPELQLGWAEVASLLRVGRHFVSLSEVLTQTTGNARLEVLKHNREQKN
jgi:hypothetical protein